MVRSLFYGFPVCVWGGGGICVCTTLTDTQKKQAIAQQQNDHKETSFGGVTAFRRT